MGKPNPQCRYWCHRQGFPGRWACTAALLLVFPSCASPHAGNVSYSNILVQDAGVHQRLQMLVREVTLAVPLDANQDGRVDPAELQAARGRLDEYLRQKVEVFSGGVSLPLRVESLEIREAQVVDSDPLPFLFADLVFESPQPLTELRIRCHLLDNVDPQHTNFAKITLHGETRPFVFMGNNAFAPGTRGTAAGQRAPWRILWNFGRLGIEHIFTGYDHMMFLIGLLLVAVRVKETVKVVSAFTLAHSIALTLAVFRVVQMPSRLVECAIAVSIMYVACENFFSWFALRRWMISFGFGLVHGLAFASALEVLHLPRLQQAGALFSFNLGIEIAQVSIVVLVLPIVAAIAKATWHRRAVQGFSLLLFCCGTLWLIQRYS